MSETPNAFSPAFLDLVKKATGEVYPVSLEFGRWNGPWVVEPHGEDRWHVRLQDGPVEADLRRHETALILAAILPISSRPLTFGLKALEDGSGGSSLMTTLSTGGYTSIGSLKSCDEEILFPLHVVHGLLTHPVSLAFVLQAAPPEVLTQAGEIVTRLWQAHEV